MGFLLTKTGKKMKFWSDVVPRFLQVTFLVLAGLFVAFIVDGREYVGLVGLGVDLMVGAGLVIVFAPHIWEKYKKSYKKPKNSTLHTLTKPNENVYNLNVYLIMPVLIALGIYLVVLGLGEKPEPPVEQMQTFPFFY